MQKNVMLIKNSYEGLLRFRTKFLFNKSDQRERGEKRKKGKWGLNIVD